MPEACIKIQNGLPKLMIDGEVTVPVMFTCDGKAIASHPQLAREIERAGRHGLRLFSVATPAFNVEKPGEFFEKLTEVLNNVLKACPEALIIPRISINRLEEFGLDSSQALVLGGSGPLKCPSLASDAWFQAAGNILQTIVRGVQADLLLNRHIIGFHYAGGDTGEWFGPGYWEGGLDTSDCNLNGFRHYLFELYKTDDAIKAAYGDEALTLKTVTLPDYKQIPGVGNSEAQQKLTNAGQAILTAPENRKIIDYFDYSNALRAERLAGLAKCIKEADETKLSVLFYGYHFDVCTSSSNHFALTRLLKSPHIDILAGPVAYFDRNDGGIGAYMSLTGSITAAGKLWMDEGDYRSPIKTGDGLVIGNLGKEGNPPTTDLLEEVIRREIGKCMIYGTGVWWFDLIWNGWYDYEGFWQTNNCLIKLLERYTAIKKRETPEICFVLDEEAFAAAGNAHEMGELLLTYGRSSLYRLGCSFGTYLLSDLLNGEIDDAKVYIMASPWRMDNKTSLLLKEKLQKPGKTTVWIYGSGITSIDDFYAASGIRLKSAKSDSGTEPEFIPESGFPSPRPYQRSTVLNPLYFAEDESEIKVLARYKNGPARGKAGIVCRENGGWRSIFYGGCSLPSELISYTAEIAGVHRFAKEEDVLFADSAAVVLHASTPGDKTIYFPCECEILVSETGQREKGDKIEIPGVTKGQTVIIFYGNEEYINLIKGEILQ